MRTRFVCLHPLFLMQLSFLMPMNVCCKAVARALAARSVRQFPTLSSYPGRASIKTRLNLHSRPPHPRLPSSPLIESESASTYTFSSALLAESQPIRANDHGGGILTGTLFPYHQSPITDSASGTLGISDFAYKLLFEQSIA